MTPFSSGAGQTVESLGEAALLECIRGWIEPVSPPPPAGFGDDAAVIPWRGGPVLATVDGLLWRRHFDASASPEAAGRKLLHRNLSDIAAMGGRPRSGVLALTFGPDLSLRWLERFYGGLTQACAAVDVTLAGGDLAETDRGTFASHLTLLGEAPERPLTRLGSRPGDAIYVTGALGGSILGWHLAFEARLAAGAWLAARRDVHAAIDVTDGLGKDLPALLHPGQTARLERDAVPIAEAARTLAARSGRSPFSHALTDGEDYELLFTLDGQSDAATFEADFRAQFELPLSRLGHIALAAGPEEERRILDAASDRPLQGEIGFEHWRV
ncbi:MAG: thiamine-monophosphate kinase [Opitutales bacterium]